MRASSKYKKMYKMPKKNEMKFVRFKISFFEREMLQLIFHAYLIWKVPHAHKTICWKYLEE
jgi:hypothetical protein